MVRKKEFIVMLKSNLIIIEQFVPVVSREWKAGHSGVRGWDLVIMMMPGRCTLHYTSLGIEGEWRLATVQVLFSHQLIFVLQPTPISFNNITFKKRVIS